MKGHVVQIEAATLKNANYHQVLFNAKHSQLVFMNLKPGEEIGEEVHELDQFIRFEAGAGTAVLDGQKQTVGDGFAVVIPAGTRHIVLHTSKTEDLKLYSLYSPPAHKDGMIHKTKQEADADEHHHFDGKTSFRLELFSFHLPTSINPIIDMDHLTVSGTMVDRLSTHRGGTK